ncbi:class 3 adenylate cyclase [Microbacterium proteolyticum]|uniref:Class 3 adenylate cyclase n=1 Tax=Microbacterium proteolyticum TaxID=1572644 RepID=A0A7W5GFR7_9MICO|nr:adenylate/guanylate cyclase domain-containing protein [Microbacterium proteolyticum]MBB3157497.1 class 3 adenylate cyclase [Microbacterium proteolyticum]
MGPENATPDTKIARRRGYLSVQSRLLIMLLAASLVSTAVVGAVGYISGRESLRAEVVDKLTAMRELRTGEITALLGEVQREAALASNNASARGASVALNAGWEELAQSPLTAAQDAELTGYYSDTFLPRLENLTGEDYGDRAFVPESSEGRTAQYLFTRQDGAADRPAADPGDGSTYTRAYLDADAYFSDLVQTVGYTDVVVTNLDGDVVYTAAGGVDLGSNLSEGPFRESRLAQGIRDVVADNSVDAVVTTDIEEWTPALGFPVMWVVSPIGDDDGITGTIALQVPIQWINDVMTGYGKWQQQGFGTTGETYLAGADRLMRSTSRHLVETPDTYADAVIADGTTAETADRVTTAGGTVLLQPVRGTAVDDAIAGRTGTAISTEYIDGESLAAYAPLEVDGLDWVIVARMDADEAFAPVTDFARTLLVSTLALMLLVSILSLLLSQSFTRPIRRLATAVRRVSDGDYDTRVPDHGNDEFADLARSFNDMAAGLRVRQDLIDHQRTENDRLLRNIMPASLAEKYREGEETLAERHDDVAVVFAEMVGFDDYARTLVGQDEILALNELTRGFDEVAARCGVESVRTLRGGYLASSGLTVPRVDNARRAVEFAVGMRASVERFNTRTGATLDLRVGVDTGSVTSGIVARASLAYDLWGDAFRLASRLRRSGEEPGVFLTDAVRLRVEGLFDLADAGSVEVDGTTTAIWRVV